MSFTANLATLSMQDERLRSAVERGDEALAKSLLRNRKVDINFAQEDGKTCLHLAISKNNIRMVRLLLAHKININPEMSLGSPPPLLFAIIHRRRELVKILIRAGADVNAKCKNITPLEKALDSNEFSSAELLIDSGAIIPEKRAIHETILFKALRRCYPAGLIKKIIDRLNNSQLRRTDLAGRNYLHTALQFYDDEKIVKLLLDRPEMGPVSKTLLFGWTALHCAANNINTKVKVMHWLLERGVDPHATDDSNCTALTNALTVGNSAIAKELINLGADVNAKTGAENFPLSLAARYCSVEIIELLISKGANLYDKNYSGKTALHDACFLRKEENIRALLLNGADPLAKDDRGQTAFQMLIQKYYVDEIHNGAAREMIRRLTATMMVDNKRIDDEDFRRIMQMPQFQQYHDQCAKEIENMKQMKIYEDVTLFHVFSIGEDKLAKLLNNDDFLSSFKSRFSKEAFPLYEVYIFTEFKRAELKMKTSCAMKRHLQEIFIPHLLDDVLNNIIDHLKISDLPGCQL